MLTLLVFLIALFVAAGAGLFAAWSDMRGLTIPNIYSAIVIVAFAAAYLFLWFTGFSGVFAPALSHLLSAVMIFAITAVLFARAVMGAADSKLATAYALWMGLRGLLPFVFYTSLFGGLLGLAALAIRRYKPFKNPAPGGWLARLQAGESKVPYGVAIVAGALASFVKLGYLDGALLRSFLGA